MRHKTRGQDALELPVLVLLLNCLRAQPLTKVTLKLCNSDHEIAICQLNNIITHGYFHKNKFIDREREEEAHSKKGN